MKLSIRNFRGIKKGEIDFKDLNILIGGNNSGKTTVLESLFLVPNPLRYVPYGIMLKL
ncbi:MAG: ATPase/GTPase [Methanophagales archaeon]|nr:ATP-binding protein [Methanophagales archaeon]MCU4139656.1 ATPase/GTPase [Methanophagales archaeon]